MYLAQFAAQVARACEHPPTPGSMLYEEAASRRELLSVGGQLRRAVSDTEDAGPDAERLVHRGLPLPPLG